MGMYTRVGNLTAGNRPVYQRVGSVDYLFYSAAARRWIIGSNYTVDASGIRSAATAVACPDEATGWQVLSGGVFLSTFPITVVSVGTSPPTPAGDPLPLRMLGI
jgi:hypothetical protein